MTGLWGVHLTEKVRKHCCTWSGNPIVTQWSIVMADRWYSCHLCNSSCLSHVPVGTWADSYDITNSSTRWMPLIQTLDSSQTGDRTLIPCCRWRLIAPLSFCGVSHLSYDCNFPALGMACSPFLCSDQSVPYDLSIRPRTCFLPLGMRSHTFSCSVPQLSAACFQNIYWICLGTWGCVHTWEHMNTRIHHESAVWLFVAL